MSENNENIQSNENQNNEINNKNENENNNNLNDKEKINDNNENEKNEIKNINIKEELINNEENKNNKEINNIENNNKINEESNNKENKKEEIKNEKIENTLNDNKQLNNEKNIEKINNKYIEESINPNILDEYKDISPIDFVGIIENNYDIFLPTSLESQLHQLSSYKEQNLSKKLKFNLFNITNSEILYNRIVKNNSNISLLKNLGKYFFICYNDGKIHIIHLEKNEEIYLESENAKVPVTSLDIYNDYLITGYKNGNIILWEYKNKKLLNSMRYSSTNTEITAIKFIHCIPKKKYEFFVCDLQGIVGKIEITIKLLLKDNIATKALYKEKNPTYMIKILNFIEDKDKNLVAFATRDKIKVYMLSTNNELISYNKPEYISEKNLNLPDIDFGYGYLPNYKKEKIIILAINWDKIINFYGFVVSSDNSINYFVSHFVNIESIYKIGFIDTSILFIIDNSNKIKLINSAFTTNGEFEYDKNKENNFILTEDAILEEGKLIENNLLKTIIKFDEKEYNIYNNYIIYEKKLIYILAESKIFIIKLLNFENCINDLINNKKWFDALNLGIDLYQGNITSLPDIPHEKNLRNKILLPILMNLLNKYIDDNFLNTDISLENLEKCMNISIEFCLSIKLIDFLFFDVQQTFAQKGKSDEFIKKIQPFILKDKLIKEEISNALPSLYVTYKTKNELSLFDHLLTHLNFKNINSDIIKRFSVIDNLFTVMIYTYENSNDYRDLFFPIVKMYKRFNEKNYYNNENKLNSFSYINLFKEKSLEDMINSKEYIGHKLLWYIDLCLLKKKFFLKKDFENENFLYFTNNDNYKKFISLIYIFLLQKEIILNLIKFDSYNYFNIISKFFLDEEIKNIINNEKFDINIYNETFNNFYKLYEKTNIPEEEIKKNENDYIKNYYDLKEVINFIIQISNSISMFLINQDLNMFLLKLATQNKNLIEKNILLKAVNQIFNFYNNYNNLTDDNEKYDKFKNHKIIFIDKYNNIDPNNSYYKEINLNLLNFIKKYENEFSFEELNEFIKENDNTPFLFPKIKILELNKVYKECLYIFLNNLDKLGGHIKLFEWINSLFTKITEKINDENENNEEFKEDLKKIQDSILDCLSDLLKISSDDVLKLIDNWFENDKKINIIKKLDSEPKLQLYLIEKILKQINENNNEKDIINSKNKSIINELILLYIDLLIKLNKQNEILNLLKKNISNFNIDEVKSKCISNDIIDAAVYLYELEGNNIEALNIVKNYLNKIYSLIISNQNNQDLNSFNNGLKIGIEICEINSHQILEENENENEKENEKKEKEKEIKIQNEKEEIEKLWFNLFELLYEYKEKAEKLNEKVSNFISLSIENFLKKMCLYVSIKKILSYTTNKYKDVKIKEFKNVLNLMLNSYSNLKSMLNNSRNIIKLTINNLDNQFKKELYHGIFCDIEYCDYCHKIFESLKKDKIKIFLCGHKVHFNCLGENEEECIVCSNLYFDTKNNNDNIKKIKKVKEKKEEQIDLGSEYLNELAEKVSPDKLNLIRIKLQRLNKLKRYEKKLNENSSFLI